MIPQSCRRWSWSCALLLCVSLLPSSAEVKLHSLFTDHMVLQRGIAVPIWGWADDGEQVTVEFRGKTVTTTAKDGTWMVKLGKLKAGGPDHLKVSGGNSLTVRDVLVGEVWIASGQSNMEWAMRNSFEPDADIKAAKNPLLRLFTVPKLKANEPVRDVKSSWQQCSPEAVSAFSAVAYYFGEFLQAELDVPVGMIHTSWGGSPAEVWMSEQVLAANPDYQRDIVDAYSAQVKRLEEAVARFEAEQAEAKRDGKPFTKRRPGLGWKPSELYNGMIAPIIPYAIKGAIWYQGESNADRAHQYRTLFPDMVRNWRRDWGQGDFPFLQVQLAPFQAIREQPTNSAWAELREAQVYATQVLPKAGVVVITDYGDEKDIHPKWKKPVAHRLSLAARKIAYGENLVWSGPMYRSLKIKGDKAIVTFDHAGEGLFARYGEGRQGGAATSGQLVFNATHGRVTGELVGFAIAGEDRRFVWAKAEIAGENKVVVSSPQVPHPVAVRYGWADFPVVNLYNSADLPASPFRTDDWPMTTAPKKEEAKK
jgi:sialate O-acetylesterase